MMNNEQMVMMMQQMMQQQQQMMQAFASMMQPQVAQAEVVEQPQPQQPKVVENKVMTREEFLAMQETPKQQVELEKLDLVVSGTRTLSFNRPLTTEEQPLWIANWLHLKKLFPNMRYNKKSKGFYWYAKDNREFVLACRASVITEVTEEVKQTAREYELIKAKKDAERAQEKLNKILEENK